MKLKQKLKSYFKAGEASDGAVELFRMYILPFMKLLNPDVTLEGTVNYFFDVKNRHFYWARAKNDFRIMGQVMVAGRRMRARQKERDIREGQILLIAADRRTQTARVDVIIEKKELTFFLERPEIEYLNDQVELINS